MDLLTKPLLDVYLEKVKAMNTSAYDKLGFNFNEKAKFFSRTGVFECTTLETKVRNIREVTTNIGLKS